MKKESLRPTGGLHYQNVEAKVLAPNVAVNLRPPVFWKSEDHDLRIQVHTPEQARRLARVEGVRLVAYSVQGSFCRIFAINKPPRWAMSWIRRALLANAAFDEPADLRNDDDAASGRLEGGAA